MVRPKATRTAEVRSSTSWVIGMLGQGFDDGANIADVQAFGEHVLQNLLQDIDRHHLGMRSSTSLGIFWPHDRPTAGFLRGPATRRHGCSGCWRYAWQRPYWHPPQCSPATGLHHKGAFNPQRRQTKGRIGGGSPLDGAQHPTWINGQILADKGFTLANFHALEHDPIFIGPDFQIIPDMHRWRRKPSSWAIFLRMPRTRRNNSPSWARSTRGISR